MGDVLFWPALTLIVCVAAVVFILVVRLRKLRHTIEHHMPEAVVRRDGWGCRAIALPGRRIWLVPTDIAEQQAMDALKETAKAYPGWIPSHRMMGRGTRAYWLLSVRRPVRKIIRREDIPAEKDPAHYVCIGLNLSRKPVMIRSDAHTLVIGLTGSGKGSIMATYVDGLSQLYEDGLVQFWGIDLKGGVEMSVYGTLFDSHHAYTLDDAVALLQDLSTECDHRMDSLRGRARELPPTPEYPRIVLLIDEAAELHGKADRKKSELVTRLLDSILRRGRALGIVVVALSQDPRVESVPLRARFPQRIALRLNSEEETAMLLGKEAIDRSGTLADRSQPAGIRIRLEPKHGNNRLFQGAVVWRRRPDGTGRVGAVRTPPSERCSRRRRVLYTQNSVIEARLLLIIRSKSHRIP